jgi:hypothetical protein
VQLLAGDLASSALVRRLRLAPLSRQAVAVLAGPHGLDPGALYETTGGNPFFVTEVLAAGHEAIPATVVDAVLARAGRLSLPARQVLDAAAVTGQLLAVVDQTMQPTRASLWLRPTQARSGTLGRQCLGSQAEEGVEARRQGCSTGP